MGFLLDEKYTRFSVVAVQTNALQEFLYCFCYAYFIIHVRCIWTVLYWIIAHYNDNSNVNVNVKKYIWGLWLLGFLEQTLSTNICTFNEYHAVQP